MNFRKFSLGTYSKLGLINPCHISMGTVELCYSDIELNIKLFSLLTESRNLGHLY
jgi:hypothetical protein